MLIIATILIYMHFISLNNIHKLAGINELVVSLNEIKNENRLYVREKDCHLRKFHIHSAIQNKEPILVMDLE